MTADWNALYLDSKLQLPWPLSRGTLLSINSVFMPIQFLTSLTQVPVSDTRDGCFCDGDTCPLTMGPSWTTFLFSSRPLSRQMVTTFGHHWLGLHLNPWPKGEGHCILLGIRAIKFCFSCNISPQDVCKVTLRICKGKHFSFICSFFYCYIV